MNKFEKIYNEYIEKPVLKFDGKVIDLYIERESFLNLLKYGIKIERKEIKQKEVLDKIKERHWKTRRNYVEDLTKLYDKLSEILEEIE